MKYKIGDVVIWDYYTRRQKITMSKNSVVAQITKIVNDRYHFRFILHCNNIYINEKNRSNIQKFDTYTRLLTDEEKLELL